MQEVSATGPTGRLRFSVVAFALVAVGSLVYAFTAYAGYRAVRDMAQHADARHAAVETLLLVERTMGLLVDLESGQRGFMLSGREEFLEPFIAARQSLMTVYPQLLRQMSASPSPGVHALQPVIDALVQKRLSAADASVETRRRWGPDPVREMSEHLHGKTLMDSLRARFASLEAFQSAEVERQNRAAEALKKLTSTVVALLTAGGTLLMFTAVGLMHYERVRRERAYERMQRATAHIEQTVTHRTSALSGAMQQMQSFTAQLDQRIEEERRRLSREVHDQLGQLATAAKMVAKDLVRSHPQLPAESIEPLTDLLDEAIVASRRISAELRPPMLDDLGLAAAAAHHLKHVAAVGHLTAECDVFDDDMLSPAQSNQLFRIMQEATTNVLRHAEARHVHVRGHADGFQYHFEVDDDGRGPQEIRPDASGVRNMKERAALAGGALHLGPRAGGGTTVVVHLPIEETP